MQSGVKFACCVLLAATLMGLSRFATAASASDIPAAIALLRSAIPNIQLQVSLSKTWSRAYVAERPEGPLLTIDPDFLAGLSSDGLLFVIAHEYAHVYHAHQKKLGMKAMELAGLPTPEMAFDALEREPGSMEKLHAMNRQFELDADEAARKWLSTVGVKACTTEVLKSIDGADMMMPIVPSHPGYYARRQVICAR
ncbi:M48 family metalloprotease [Limnobacter sp.]|uniref:M48 family metalloprotease n=1 Tax=Limnobacter sp. TaxID=2003368 RepID=UPI0035135596